METIKKNSRKLALGLIIGPPLGILLILVTWSVLSFVINVTTIGGNELSRLPVIFNIVNVVLGFLSILCVLGFIIGLPMGLILLARANKEASLLNLVHDERSGKGEASIVPEELKGWNWGAFFLGWIWGLYHSVWFSLLTLIPVVGLIFSIVLGLHGNEYAWKSMRWENVEQFKRSQNTWARWGVGIFLVIVSFKIFSVIIQFS